jgi:hypothetical protein
MNEEKYERPEGFEKEKKDCTLPSMMRRLFG